MGRQIYYDTELRAIVNVAREDFGHPDGRRSWDKWHLNYRQGALVCVESRDEGRECPDGLVLYVLHGKRFARHHSQDACLTAQRETAEHVAMKERLASDVTRLSDLRVYVEEPAPDRSFVSDVLVVGPAGKIGGECQLSHQTLERTRERSRIAARHDVTDVWITPSPSAQYVERVPSARTNQLPVERIPTAPLPIYGGVRDFEFERCAGRSTCPRRQAGRPCYGWHEKPIMIPRLEVPQLLVDMANGDFVPLEWRNKNGLYVWIVPPESRDRYMETNQDRYPDVSLVTPARKNGSKRVEREETRGNEARPLSDKYHPVKIPVPNEKLTPAFVDGLKRILTSHSGPTELRIETQTVLMRLPDGLRITYSPALMDELAALLGERRDAAPVRHEPMHTYRDSLYEIKGIDPRTTQILAVTANGNVLTRPRSERKFA